MSGAATPPAAPALPIGPAEAEALLASSSTDPAVLLAVSGGPDSLALMHLCAAWGQSPGRPRLHVATVDHGLRPGSAEEAARVAAWAAALGLPHATLGWMGAKPATGLQAAAREARYALLEAHAVALGAAAVLTAHHADDQAETVLMRLARGSGPAGLAGMRAERPLGRVLLRRPLLAVPKARLVATVEAARQPWIEDPSNDDPRFGRTGMRRAWTALERVGVTRERIVRLAERQARVEAVVEAVAREAAASSLRVGPDGAVSLSVAALDAAGAEVAVRLLCRAIAIARGREPGTAGLPLERIERLAGALVAAGRAGVALSRTAGGCLVRLRLAEVTIMAEKERRRGRRPRSRPAKDAAVG